MRQFFASVLEAMTSFPAANPAQEAKPYARSILKHYKAEDYFKLVRQLDAYCCLLKEMAVYLSRKFTHYINEPTLQCLESIVSTANAYSNKENSRKNFIKLQSVIYGIAKRIEKGNSILNKNQLMFEIILIFSENGLFESIQKELKKREEKSKAIEMSSAVSAGAEFQEDDSYWGRVVRQQLPREIVNFLRVEVDKLAFFTVRDEKVPVLKRKDFYYGASLIYWAIFVYQEDQSLLEAIADQHRVLAIDVEPDAEGQYPGFWVQKYHEGQSTEINRHLKNLLSH